MTVHGQFPGATRHLSIDVPETMPMRNYSFRQFTLNLARRTLFNGQTPVRLNAKSFDLLLMLIQKAGAVVTKEEILSELWNESFVEEGNIAVHVSKLRLALGETKESKFIQTVSGNGYCFVAPVKETVSEVLAGRDASLRFESLAVLPFENETGEQGLDYLAEGLADSFINSLSRIPGLRVISRHTAFRYKTQEDRLKAIGDALGVEAVMTGRVRGFGDTFIVGVELTECDTSRQVWGDQLVGNAADIIGLQASIVSKTSRALQDCLQLAGVPDKFRPFTHDIESHRMFLKGKFFYEKRSVQDVYKSIMYFERSVSYDPANVSSYVGLIESYRLLFGLDELTFEEARSFIDPMIEIVVGLDASSDSAQTMLGGVKMYFDWNFSQAERHLVAAIDMNRNNLDAHSRYSDLLLIQRRFGDARKEVNKILSLDPISTGTFKRVGKAFYRMEQYATATHYLAEALEMNPSDYEALAVAAAVDIETGEYDRALERLRQSMELESNPEVVSMFGYLYGRSGQTDSAKKEIVKFRKQYGDAHPLKLARIFAAIGETESALGCLDLAIEQHDVDLIGLNSDPRWSKISEEPRFVKALETIGLTQN